MGYLWSRWLLGVGALCVLAAALWYRRLGLRVPRAPLALAAALLVTHLPGSVWAALSDYAVWGLNPLGWAQTVVATGAALAVLAGPSVGALRRRW